MNRPDPLIPNRPGAQDTECMANRIIWMTELYKLDGRADPDHPMHGLYTGLNQKYINSIG